MSGAPPRGPARLLRLPSSQLGRGPGMCRRRHLAPMLKPYRTICGTRPAFMVMQQVMAARGLRKGVVPCVCSIAPLTLCSPVHALFLLPELKICARRAAHEKCVETTDETALLQVYSHHCDDKLNERHPHGRMHSPAMRQCGAAKVKGSLFLQCFAVTGTSTDTMIGWATTQSSPKCSLSKLL